VCSCCIPWQCSCSEKILEFLRNDHATRGERKVLDPMRHLDGRIVQIAFNALGVAAKSMMSLA
jgi:hypothetical protein